MVEEGCETLRPTDKARGGSMRRREKAPTMKYARSLSFRPTRTGGPPDTLVKRRSSQRGRPAKPDDCASAASRCGFRGNDEVGLTAYGNAREAGRPQGTLDSRRRLKRLVPPSAIRHHAAGEVKQQAVEGDVGETEKRPRLARIDGVPHDGYRMQHRPEEAGGLQDPTNLPEALPEIGVRERHSRRSEERRVGKECRSRWSPYH